MDEDRLRQWMAVDLADIAATRMPFGKYGPDHYPPRGVPLYDLPVEYLGWFVKKGGFPKGRLGELLRIVHQMKVDGLDEVFDELRRRAGGRTPLRTPNRQGNTHFE
jgi:uncharacterized protein (DUF3820 family)